MRETEQRGWIFFAMEMNSLLISAPRTWVTKKISILVHNIRKSTPLKYAMWTSCIITLSRRTLLPWSVVCLHLPIGTVCTGDVRVALSAKIPTPFLFFFLTINMTSACCTVGYRRLAMATATSWRSTWKLKSPLDLMMRFDVSTCHLPLYSACQLITLLGLPARHSTRLASSRHSTRLASSRHSTRLASSPRALYSACQLALRLRLATHPDYSACHSPLNLLARHSTCNSTATTVHVFLTKTTRLRERLGFLRLGLRWLWDISGFEATRTSLRHLRLFKATPASLGQPVLIWDDSNFFETQTS